MSKTIKFTLSDEYYDKLVEKAGTQTLQDYIRSVLFPEYKTDDEITPEKAVTLALETYKKGDGFTVPEIFGDSWNLKNGYAGVFGKRFNKLVREQYSDKIRFTGVFNVKGHAIYEIIG